MNVLFDFIKEHPGFRVSFEQKPEWSFVDIVMFNYQSNLSLRRCVETDIFVELTDEIFKMFLYDMYITIEERRENGNTK